MLVDAIGPDELRVIKNGVQISKEPLRQYHKLHQAEWFEKTKEAKRIDPINWIDVCEEKLNSRPEPMEPEFKALCEGMYQSLTNSLTGRDWFPDAPPLDEVVEGLKSSGIA